MEIKDVENLAELARLELSPEEKTGLLKDMDSILDYVKAIEEADVEESESDLNPRNIWREDLSRQAGEERQFSRDLIINQFPDSQDGFLKVKKIL